MRKLDPKELLPFCLRCFGVGAVYDEGGGYCHMCGSQGTCVPLARKDIEYAQENERHKMVSAYKNGMKAGKKKRRISLGLIRKKR